MELTWTTNIDFALNSTPRPNTEKVIKVFHPTSKSAAAAFVAESAIKEPQDVFLKPLNRSFRPFSASQNEPQPASNDVTMFSPTWVFLHKRFFSTSRDFFRVCSSEIDSFCFFETFQSFWEIVESWNFLTFFSSHGTPLRNRSIKIVCPLETWAVFKAESERRNL